MNSADLSEFSGMHEAKGWVMAGVGHERNVHTPQMPAASEEPTPEPLPQDRNTLHMVVY
jgi:hypothetical protein